MSTTTVSYSSTPDAVSLADLRRKEEEAREALRRRMGQAKQAVAVQENRYAKLLASLDARRTELPDLTYVIPSLPGAPSGQDPKAFERHAENLSGLIDKYEQQVRQALDEAELALHRRKQLAATWNEIHDINSEINIRNQACGILAEQLGDRFDTLMPTSRLNKNATLEEAQVHLQSIRLLLQRLQTQQGQLTSRIQSREKAFSLSGDSVNAVSSAERLSNWEQEKSRQARVLLQNTVDTALIAAGLEMKALPKALQLLVTFAMEQAQHVDLRRQIADLINRHRVRLDGVSRAEKLLANPPQYADNTTGAMTSRWRKLVNQLEAVICGLDDWSNSLELEHTQTHQDSIRAMQRAYAKSHFIETATDSNFHISEGDDGLVLMDIDQYPGYFVTIENQQDEDGYLTRMQLMADPSIVGDESSDSAVTERVCAQLQAMAQADRNIVTGVQEVERNPRVTRKRRPVRRLTQATPL